MYGCQSYSARTTISTFATRILASSLNWRSTMPCCTAVILAFSLSHFSRF